MRWTVLLVTGLGCGGEDKLAPAPAPPASAASAAPAATAVSVDAAPAIDAPPAMVYRCDARMTAKGYLRVRIDPTTLAGEITRVTAGAALTRHLHVTAEPQGAVLTLRFDRYDPSDHTTIRGVKRPRPAGEKLVTGESIVARLETVAAGTARFHVDGDVDWTTDSFLVVQDNHAPCVEVAGDP